MSINTVDTSKTLHYSTFGAEHRQQNDLIRDDGDGN